MYIRRDWDATSWGWGSEDRKQLFWLLDDQTAEFALTSRGLELGRCDDAIKLNG